LGYRERQVAFAERYKKVRSEYYAIDTARRQELRAIAEERIQRSDLVAEPGEVEEAVVRMYKRKLQGQSSPD
jgi:hypothetical protein